jgi:hypothetical protein
MNITECWYLQERGLPHQQLEPSKRSCQGRLKAAKHGGLLVDRRSERELREADPQDAPLLAVRLQ